MTDLRRFCHSCNEEVSLEITLVDNGVDYVCNQCGTKLAEEREGGGAHGIQAPAGMHDPGIGAVRTVSDEHARVKVAAPMGYVAPAPPPAAQPQRNIMDKVLLAEDSELLRSVTTDLILERQLAREVVSAPDGQAFLREFVAAHNSRVVPSLAILDLNMPRLNGAHTALAMRAIERGFGFKTTPILFFSSMPLDDKLKKLVQYLGKAAFVRKEGDAAPMLVAERLVQVLKKFAS